MPIDARLQVEGRRARGDHLVAQTWEELVERLTAPGEQGVDVTALWGATPRGRFDRKLVAVDQRNALEGIAEHSSRAQTTDRGTDHDRVAIRRDRTHPTHLENWGATDRNAQTGHPTHTRMSSSALRCQTPFIGYPLPYQSLRGDTGPILISLHAAAQ